MDKVLVQVSELREMAQKILLANKVSEKDSQLITETLLDAECSGVESHGLMRLPVYVERLRRGLINPKPKTKLIEKGSVILVDGDNGPGQVVAAQTMKACIKGAKQLGICFASICHSNHFGTASYYTRMASDAMCIGFAGTTTGRTMAPFGGMDPLLGTDPLAVSFPIGNGQHFTIDMAMSGCAKGKIRIYEKQGKEIPLGWALDKSGNDTTNPKAALEGVLLPMAGHKGYGLAIVVEALSALLSGANLSYENDGIFASSSPGNIGHFIGAINIEHFLPPEQFQHRVQTWFQHIRQSRTRPGFEKILIPGEPEELSRKSCQELLPVLDKTYRKMCQLVSELQL